MKKYIKPEMEMSKFELDADIALGAVHGYSVTSGSPTIDGGSVDFIGGWLGL